MVHGSGCRVQGSGFRVRGARWGAYGEGHGQALTLLPTFTS